MTTSNLQRSDSTAYWGLEDEAKSARVFSYELIPRPAVTPDVAGSPQSYQEFGDGTLELNGLRYTINPDDDIDAGNRLLNGFPEVGLIRNSMRIAITSSVPITSLYVVGQGNSTSAGGPGLSPGELIGVVGAIGTDATETETRNAMVQFNFDEADEVQRIILTTTILYTATAAPASAGTFVGLLVEGRSYV